MARTNLLNLRFTNVYIIRCRLFSELRNINCVNNIIYIVPLFSLSGVELCTKLIKDFRFNGFNF